MKYIKQICIILSICLLAELMERLLPLPVAASMYGLVLMLLALVTKIVKLTDVEDVADFLTGNLAIMFVPPTVGVMASIDEMKKMLVPLFVISIVTTLLIMSVTGWATQRIMKGRKKTEEKRAEVDAE